MLDGPGGQLPSQPTATSSATLTPTLPVISTHGLVKRFKDVDAVAGIDLNVPAGGVYGFLGPNGAGKTTTIRILLGLLRPTRGSASLFGDEITPGRLVLDRVGALVERPGFYPYLSATDNLRLFGLARGIPDRRLRPLVPEALDRVGLTTASGRRAGGFSTGMRQRLGIAAALLGRPELVILDEPANGLDPNGVVDVRGLISSLARDGVTVFLSSHVLPEVEQLCRRVAILQAGKIIAEGETQAMLSRGERLFVRFDTIAEALRGRPILEGFGPVTPMAGGDAYLVDGASGRSSAVARRLAEDLLYPAELGIRRQTLERVFMDLTGERDPATRESTSTAQTADDHGDTVS
jgi:ABC-2 type transport system ATP-binding protein